MRILMRGYKHPLSVMQPEEVLRGNVLGRNSGNLLFGEATYRALSTTSAEITLSDFSDLFDQADRINNDYDAVVLPFANAFRRDYVETLAQFTALIRRLRIPVTILGIGAQSDLDYGSGALDGLAHQIKDFAAAVLDRSPSIGVRGAFTQSHLQGLGFDAVRVIGCPSMS